MKILSIGAHPDDEVLGMGGTLLRLADEENKIFLLSLTLGETARGKRVAKPDLRIKQAQKVADRLKAVLLPIRDFPDCAFDTVPLLTLTKLIEKHIKDISPDVIYTCHGGDLNIDHQRTFQAVITAARPGKTSTKKIYSFEVLSSTEWQAKNSGNIFLPNTYVDVEKYIDGKVNLLKIYPQEMGKFPFPRSREGIEALARYRGMESGLRFAEAFHLVRNIVM